MQDAFHYLFLLYPFADIEDLASAPGLDHAPVDKGPRKLGDGDTVFGVVVDRLRRYQ